MFEVKEFLRNIFVMRKSCMYLRKIFSTKKQIFMVIQREDQVSWQVLFSLFTKLMLNFQVLLTTLFSPHFQWDRCYCLICNCQVIITFIYFSCILLLSDMNYLALFCLERTLRGKCENFFTHVQLYCLQQSLIFNACQIYSLQTIRGIVYVLI